VQRELGADQPVIDTLREAITQASTAHDDRLVSELWTTLLAMLGTQRRVDEARTLLPAAEAALARSKSSTQLFVNFLDSKAIVLSVAGDAPGALAALATAAQSLDAAGAASPASPLHALSITIKVRIATTHTGAGQWAEAVKGYREAIPLAVAHYGADQLIVMRMHFNFGVTLRRMGDNAAALAEFREAARIGEARLVASPALAELLFAVGSTQVALGKQGEAIPMLKRSVDMARSTLPPADPRLADSLSPLAAAYVDTEHYAEAKQILDEVIAILEKRTGKPDEKIAIAYSNRGQWALDTHHCADAWPDLDRALAIYVELKQSSDAYDVLYLRAECQLETRQWAAAAATTERTLAGKDASPTQHAEALFDHGKALWNLGRRAEGSADVRAARDAMKHDELDTDGAELATKWLAAHGQPK